jgi:hypothetical protein
MALIARDNPSPVGSAAPDGGANGGSAVRAISLRIVSPIRDLSAEDVALILALGLVLGAFPVYGCPTILCVLASLALRVNFPALQVVNQLSWPLQIAMLVPLARLGSRIIAPSGGLAATFAGRLGATVLQAIVGWFCVCIPLGILLYIALAYLLRRNRRQWWGNVKISPPSAAPAPAA